MITDKQRRNQILRKIQKMPPERLRELQEFIENLEETTPRKKEILSYAGAWSGMDESILENLTDNLIDRRQNNKRRFEE